MISVRSATFRFRLVLSVFIAGLILSGVTAFPLLAEMRLAVRFLGLGDATSATGFTGLSYWILTVRFGLEDMYAQYPWIAYGTDWLAFGHIIIALFFVGSLFRPSESKSVLYVGIIACFAIVPFALICGEIRGIPVYWRMIDCMFGVVGILHLIYCLRLRRIIKASEPDKSLKNC
jgi:hypothetical protein